MKSNKWFLLMMFALVLMLAACGPDRPESGEEAAGEGANGSGEEGSEPEKPEVLNVWLDGENQMEVYGEIFEKYEEETGIAVEFTEVGMTDQLEQLSLDAPAGQGPDLYQQPHDMIGSAYLQGLGMELDPSEFELDAFNENALEAFTYEGSLMGVPFAVEAAALYYNKDIIDEAPQTVEELEAIMEEYTDESNNEYGFLMEATNFYFSYPLLFSGDEQIFGQEEDGSYNSEDLQVATDGVVEQATRMQEWFQAGYLSENVTGDVLDGLFTDGKAPVAMTGPWKLSDYSDALGDSLGTATLPELDGETMTPFMGVKGWMISEYTENEYWSKDLLKFMTNADNSKLVTEGLRETVPRSDVENSNELLRVFNEQAENANPMPNIPEMAQVWEPMGDALIFISNGDDPREVLEEAKSQIQTDIDSASGGQDSEE
ncbi:extracellular solute-binding protein [Salinicoccus roseus]|uniref:Maltodextrin-binding protein n=1 Tax=Salinicoccus roseus TaxID=45670 RepID=A0A265E3W8_9STAP|nr:extracellular solute-binding protein [Salinicoccus roseus]OZT76205.1 hypothetical protein CFN03_12915 [Salinicoccus roseus]